MPHTAGRYQIKRFRKAQCPIVERLCNALMRKGRNNGKKLLALRIVQQTFEIIHLLTDENPLQVYVRALVNAGPREDSTRVGAGGVVRRQAVDVAPFRRINQAIYLMGIGAREVSVGRSAAARQAARKRRGAWLTLARGTALGTRGGHVAGAWRAALLRHDVTARRANRTAAVGCGAVLARGLGLTRLRGERYWSGRPMARRRHVWGRTLAARARSLRRVRRRRGTECAGFTRHRTGASLQPSRACTPGGTW